MELEPNFWIALLSIAKVYVAQGRYEEAIAELTKANQLSGGSAQPLSMLGYTFAVMGNHEEALGVLDELETLASKRYVPPYNSALVHNGLHDNDNTFAWLERAFESRDVLLAAFITTDPVWTRLNDHPRFKDLLVRMNLL